MLIINAEVQEDIEKIKKHARANVFSVQDITDIMKGKKKPPGDDSSFMCMIPVGFKVVPAGRSEHLSISTAGCGQLPTYEETHKIAKAFGMKIDWVTDVEETTNSYGSIYHEDMGGGECALSIISKEL